MARLGHRLQPLRGVHHVAHRRRVAARSHRADEDLARVDADPDAHRHGEIGTHAGKRLVHPERGADCPLGVVLVSDGRTEEGDDLVTHDLVEAAAERRHVGHEPLEAVVHEPLDLLGIGDGRHAGEADEVGHQDRDEPPLVGSRDKPVPALRAEPGAFGYRRPASRAIHEATLPAPTPSLAAARWCFRSGLDN